MAELVQDNRNATATPEADEGIYRLLPIGQGDATYTEVIAEGPAQPVELNRCFDPSCLEVEPAVLLHRIDQHGGLADASPSVQQAQRRPVHVVVDERPDVRCVLFPHWVLPTGP